MSLDRHHKTTFFPWALKVVGLVLILGLGAPLMAQNTKGDKPQTSRESRFRIPTKKSSQKKARPPGKRVSTKKKAMSYNANNYTPRRRARGGERAGRPTRPIAGTKPSDKQKAWSGDIAGRRIRAKSAPARTTNVYPQYGRYTHNPSRTPKSKQRSVSNKSTLARLKKLQTPARAHKFYPQQNRYVNNPSKTPRSTQNPSSNRGTLSRLKKLQSSPPRVYKKSINVYANFRRPKRKAEQPYLNDISGRPLRKKNFETPRPGVVSPTFKPYQGRGKMGDKPYSGRSGGYGSATKRRQEAWTGDIAGRRIRGRNFSSKRAIEGTPILPVRRNRDRFGDRPYSGKVPWYRTATRAGETRPGLSPLPRRTPGIGADRIGKFQGNIKGGKPLKGGGSVSGRLWNNDGRPLDVRTPKQGSAAALFQGNIKAKRPQKGGGSVSGKLWNNNETPVPGKTYSPAAKKVGGYPGRNKMFDLHPGFADQGERFTGYIKLKKFKKNYVQHPDAAEESVKKKRQNKRAFEAEGLQVKVQQRESGRKPHAAEGSLPGIRPSKTSVKANEYARGIRRTWNYVKNPSSADEALKTREPGKAFARVSAYQGNIKMQKFSLFEKNRALHPDTKFIKTNKNNVPEEKDLLTNFKLWWARLFKKQETQPEHLKEKGTKPRYDKGEAGMWYE
ncbi:MAG TPA: hypothetical protein VFZ52_25320 [Chryseolinea sp.]